MADFARLMQPGLRHVEADDQHVVRRIARLHNAFNLQILTLIVIHQRDAVARLHVEAFRQFDADHRITVVKTNANPATGDLPVRHQFLQRLEPHANHHHFFQLGTRHAVQPRTGAMHQPLRRLIENALQLLLRHTGTVPRPDVKIRAEGAQFFAHFGVNVEPDGKKRRHDGRPHHQRGKHHADPLKTQTQRPPHQQPEHGTFSGHTAPPQDTAGQSAGPGTRCRSTQSVPQSPVRTAPQSRQN